MSSGTSTDAAPRDASFRVWHFYLLLSMCGATAAVVLSRQTHPIALLLLSAASLAAGGAAYALHNAIAGFSSGEWADAAPIAESDRQVLEREKALLLRSIKELEFDHAMKKVSDADFADMGGRLRARALVIMADLDRAPAIVVPRPVPPRAPDVAPGRSARAIAAAVCAACRTVNEPDARFCKHCGAKLVHD